MDSVERTLLATQNLLCALEQDSSLLQDEYFMRKLSYLRSKHKETTEFLSKREKPADPLKATYHTTPGCNHFWSDLRNPHIHTNTKINNNIIHRTQPIDSTSTRGEPVIPSAHGGYGAHVTSSQINDSIGSPAGSGRPFVTDGNEVARRMAKEAQRNSRRIQRNERRGLGEGFSREAVVIEEDDVDRRSDVTRKTSQRSSVVARDNSQRKLSKELSKSVHEIREGQRSAEKERPKTTVPRPFSMSTRKSNGNTYAQKFMCEMLEKKEREEEERRELEDRVQPFKAHPVPPTTYTTSNPLVTDKKYVDALQKRIQSNMKRNFEKSRSKSMSDVSIVSAVARPVPMTTYVAPALQNYRRQKTSNRRAVRMLTEAHTPPGLKEHGVRTAVMSEIRHRDCQEEARGNWKGTRTPMPDFERLQREFAARIKKTPHKPPTIPVPFHLTEPKTSSRHRDCKSCSPPPPRRRSHSIVVNYDNPTVQTTNSVLLRDQAIREKMKKLGESRRTSEHFWEERKVDAEANRERIRSTIRRSQSSGTINRTEGRRNIMETSREYQRELMEIRQRVLSRPLIMERQSILAQQQQIERQYKETMKNVGKTKVSSRMLGARGISDESSSSGGTMVSSGGTFVKSAPGSERSQMGEYKSDDFESDEEGLNASGGSVNSSESSKKSSGSSKNSSSTSGNSKESKLSKISETSEASSARSSSL